MTVRHAMHPLHAALALLVVAIWGTNFVVIRWGLDELPPFAFVFMRFLLCALPLVFFMPRPAVSTKWLASFGILLGPGQFALLFWAMRNDISPGLASLVIQMQVFFTILLAAAFFRETVSRLGIAALLFALLGLGVVGAHGDGSISGLGLLLVLGAALCWAGANIVVKLMTRAGNVKPNMLAFVAWSSLFALPPLFLLVLLEGGGRAWSAVITLSGIGWFSVAWQAFGNTLLGFVAWSWLLARYPAAIVAPYALLVPVFGIAASAVALGEPLHGWKVAGAAMIIVGIAAVFWDGVQKLRR